MESESVRSILDSLIEVVSEKGYIEASIADICHRCDISRRTFYRYFQTKEEAVKAQIKSDTIDPSLTFRSQFPQADKRAANDIMQAAAFHNISENKEFYEQLRKAMGSAHLIELFVDVSMSNTRDIWRTIALEENDYELDYITYLYSYISASSIVYWLEGHNDLTPTVVSNMMDRYGFAYWREKAGL